MGCINSLYLFIIVGLLFYLCSYFFIHLQNWILHTLYLCSRINKMFIAMAIKPHWPLTWGRSWPRWCSSHWHSWRWWRWWHWTGSKCNRRSFGSTGSTLSHTDPYSSLREGEREEACYFMLNFVLFGCCFSNLAALHWPSSLIITGEKEKMRWRMSEFDRGQERIKNSEKVSERERERQSSDVMWQLAESCSVAAVINQTNTHCQPLHFYASDIWKVGDNDMMCIPTHTVNDNSAVTCLDV